MKKVFFIFIFLFLTICASAQNVTGFLSIKPSSVALGCGCTGCNDAAYAGSVTYPDPSGVCGTTEPSANSGGCSTLSKNISIVVPDGCTVSITGCFGDRTGCSGVTQGPGMDGGDQFSIVGTGGLLNCNSGIITGASNTSTCVTLSQVGGTVSFNLTANRVSELLTYTLAYTGGACVPGPLPIELLNFDVYHNPEKFLVEWATLSEKNTRDFEIQHSTNGTEFTSLQKILAAGNSRTLKNYSHAIKDTLETNDHYFRLRQNDLDGTFSFSRVVYVSDISAIDLRVFPNPSSSGVFVISSGTFLHGDSECEVFDFMGKLIHRESLSGTRTSIDLSSFERGVYLVKLREGHKFAFKKLVFE